MIPLDTLLDTLPPWILVGGKGGVGKTTCAAALAARSSARPDTSQPTLLLSIDPAGALGTALGVPLTGTPVPVPTWDQLHAMQLDPVAARERFLAQWRSVLVTILDRGTYLDRDDISGLVDAALPGLDETMALLTLLDLAQDRWARIVLDTAPTGHALRFLELPGGFRALIALLETMQDKHRFMVQALTHRYRPEQADWFLDRMRSDLEALERVLTDPRRVAVVLVTRPEPLVAEESVRYARALAQLHIAIGAVVINAVPDEPLQPTERAALETIAAIAPDVPRLTVPQLHNPLMERAGLVAWGSAARLGAPTARAAPASTEERAPRARERGGGARVTVRPLTIVGGKGGVGKTTVACALGVTHATPERPVLLVSTDPAPSVADALAEPVGEDPVPITGAPGLHAQQLDASAAFARFRERYSARVDELFDALLRGSLDAVHDRRIARDLLALAPPGIDELYALAMLGETVAQEKYAAVIVDPAPTGHLLRLLQLPAIALEWSHRLLRLMLKYKDLVGLGPAAEELVAFARRTRQLDHVLHDPARAGVLIVALDEPLVRAETTRLTHQIGALGIAPLGVVWNRARNEPHPLPPMRDAPQFEAAEVAPAPRGANALRQWAMQWESLAPSAHE
ncbi:MAG: ArsA family ATPase [Gemmatimonadaceae bacterium]|nr:ArsA family ATPase [Gemmatimonadaceae bacterium]